MKAVHSRIPCVTLPRSGLSVSRIGVGLAHLHLMPPPARATLIDTAIDLGMTHFDTSRFYSDGLSEEVLGSLLGARRAQVTITTKFGLLPTPLIGRMGRMAPLGRKLRSAATRLKLTHYPKQRYTPDTLRRSLAASLKALRTDHVDVFAIHEPAHRPNGLASCCPCRRATWRRDPISIYRPGRSRRKSCRATRARSSR